MLPLRIRIFALLFVLTVIFLVRQGRESDSYQCLDCNVVLIVIDTLRADYHNFSPDSHSLTPNLDRFVQNGTVFSQAVSSSSWTLPAMMSLMTGVYPSRHKLTNKYVVSSAETSDDGLEIMNLSNRAGDLLTLAEIFHTKDYSTAGFTGGAGVGKEFGFDKGFDIYDSEQNFGGFSYSAPKAIDWVDSHKNSKFFLFLHGYDVHGQYEPENGFDYRYVSKGYSGKFTGSKDEQKELREEGLEKSQLFLTPEDVAFWKGIYAEKIEKTDEELGRFFDEYQKRGLMDKTIFVITADHGEEFMEHDRLDHGPTLYEEIVRIPLYFIIPGKKYQEVKRQVRQIDIMPTLLFLTGATIDKWPFDQPVGDNLFGTKVWLRSFNNSQAFMETDYRYYVSLVGLRTSNILGKRKYIYDNSLFSGRLLKISDEPPFENIGKEDFFETKLFKTKQKILFYLHGRYK